MYKTLYLVLSVIVSTAPLPTKNSFTLSKIKDTSIYESNTVYNDLQGTSLSLEDVSIGKSLNEQQKEREYQQKIAIDNNKQGITPRTGYTYNPESIQEEAYNLFISTFNSDQWQFFVDIINSESGWNPKALNISSGACGLPQSLPCNKLPQGIDTSPHDQIMWTIEYIKNRYGNPQVAWSFHLKMGWY